MTGTLRSITERPPPSSVPTRPTTTILVAAALAVAGLALRFWVLRSHLGPLDGDEAVTALMGRHLLHHGELPAFFWGQEYSGSGESVVVAALLALRVPLGVAAKLVPLGLSALAAWLLWRLGRRTVGAPAAALGAALWWLAPAAFVWGSVKERGSYELTVVLGLALLVLVLQTRDQPSWKRAGAAGLVAGLGWWTNPQIAYVAVPAVAWLFVTQAIERSLGPIRYWWSASLGALVGAAPWLARNLRTGFASLTFPPTLPQTTYLHRLSLFWHFGLPTALGWRIPNQLSWVGGAAGKVLTLATVAAIGVAVVAARGPRVLLAAVAVAYPLLYAAAPTSFYYGEPRYLSVLSPMVALLLAWSIVATARRVPAHHATQAVAAVATLAALAVAVYGLHAMASFARTPDQAQHDVDPVPIGPALAALRRQGITRVWGDYWIVQRMTAETNEAVIGAPGQLVRYQPYEDAVRSAARAAYLVMAGSCFDTHIATALRELGVAYDEVRAGEIAVITPARNVFPEQVLPDWGPPRGLPGAPVC